MKRVTCCNLDSCLNLKHIHELDDYVDENFEIVVVLTNRVPYIDQEEGILYMSSEDAVKYLNRGGRNLKFEIVN